MFNLEVELGFLGTELIVSRTSFHHIFNMASSGMNYEVQHFPQT